MMPASAGSCGGVFSLKAAFAGSCGDRAAGPAGADGGIRTHDLPLTRRLLCQLSYVGDEFGKEFRDRAGA
jgi:hypothetical protein